MNLFENPFYVLKISPRVSKQGILEAFDDKSLSIDFDLCTKARATLTHPRNRLSAEISWVHGISPKRSFDLIESIEIGTDDIESKISDLRSLTQCNILSSLLTRKDMSNYEELSDLILQIAKSFDQIDINNLHIQINEERVPAGMPQIKDVSQIENALNQHRKYIVTVFHNALNKVENPDLVFAEIVNIVTVEGKFQAPLLIDELCDLYQIEVQKYLDKMYEKIQVHLSKIKSNDSKNIESINKNIDLLEIHLREWDQIAQPIQLIMKSRGLDDKHSVAVADEVRDLAIYLANDHSLHDEAKKIADFMSDIFEELPEFSEQVTRDIDTLDNLINKKTEFVKDEQEWRDKRTFNTEIGSLFFKKKLAISPETIHFNNESIQTDSVSMIKWWTSRSYNVWIGNDNKVICIEPPYNSTYNRITDALWYAVCTRLFTETLSDLSLGEKISYGPVIVDKDGVLLLKHKLFSTEPFYGKWEDLSISNGNGSFIISSSNDKKAYVELAYGEYYNVHILETVIRFLWKDGNYAKLTRGEFAKTSDLEEKQEDEVEQEDKEDLHKTYTERDKYFLAFSRQSSFILEIDDVHHAKDGTVVTGIVAKGELTEGDEVYILSHEKNSIKALVSGIEIGSEIFNTAKGGDSIGILLDAEVSLTDIENRDIIVKDFRNSTDSNLIRMRCHTCKHIMTVSFELTPRGKTIKCFNCSIALRIPQTK